MRFDPSSSLLAGLDVTLMQSRLTALQQAYLDLAAGQKVVTVSYTQGDGAKSATYTKTDMAQLTITIRQLQAQLGLIQHPRRALGVRF